MLKELTEDGAYAADVHFNYEGEFRLKVSAAGSFSIRGTNLGRATAQLNVRILSIQGNLRIKINKPPSNRVWWCFTEPPQIVMHVEPILASRKMQLNALTRVIEKQIREGIADACVFPYCDDLPFFDTSNLKPRGGIFDEFSKKRGPNTVPISTEMGAEGLEPKPTPMDKVSTASGSPARRRSTSLSAAPPSMAAEALASSIESTARHGRSDSDTHFTAGVDRSPTDAASTSTLAKSISGGTKKWFAGRASGESTVASSPTTLSTHPESIAPILSRNIPGTRDSSPHSLVEGPRTRLLPEDLEGTTRPSPLPEPSENPDNVLERKVTPETIPLPTAHSPALSRTPAEDSHSTRAPPTDNVLHNDMTAGSLMDTIRTRAKDKQALQTSVTQAKDAMRKWGTNWATKRNLPIGSLPKSSGDPPVVPPAESTPSRQATPTLSPPSHRKPDVRGVEIPRAGLSLQERLANATQLATSPDRKPRHSAELDNPMGNAHMSRSVNEDEKLIPRQSGVAASKVSSEVQDLDPISASLDSKRLSGEKPSIKLATANHPVKPDLPLPRLPPRAHAEEGNRRASSESASHVTSSPAFSKNETALTAPPPLPPRLPTESEPSEFHKMQAPSTNNALPSPSLPRAEEVLKSVMAASQSGGDPK